MKLNVSKKMILLLLGCLLFLSACGRKQPETEQDIKADFTLMVYMCGSNLETDFGAGTNAVKEMLEAELPEGVNVCFDFGGASKWHYGDINSKANSYAVIKDQKLEILDTSSAKNMGRTDTVNDFIRWSVEHYPAENYGIIFWNHGGGSLAGICKDEVFDYDYLEIAEIGQCLSYGSKLIEKKFDFVCFDACLMANYETAKTVAPYADYMLASEEALSSGGFEYKKSLTKLGQADFKEFFLDCFIEKSESRNRSIYTISCVDLSQFDKLERAFDGFLEEYKATAAGPILKAAGAAEHLGSSQRKIYSNQLDLGSFANKLGDEKLSKTLNEILTVKNGLLCTENSGLSFFFPLCSTGEADAYIKCGYNAKYNSFLEEFLQETAQSTITLVNPGKNREEKLEVLVTEESAAQISKTNCKTYLLNAAGEWEYIGDNDEVSLAKNTLSACIPAFLLTLDDVFIPAQIYQETGKYTEYRTSVSIKGLDAELFIGYEKADSRFFIEGYVIDEETDLESRLVELEEGDIITIKPPSNAAWAKTVELEYRPDKTLQLKKSPEGTYRLQMEIYDMNMDVFYSDCIDIKNAYK